MSVNTAGPKLRLMREPSRKEGEMKVSEQEYRPMVKEVAERLRDVAYLRADILADQMMRKLNLHKGIPDSSHSANKVTFTIDVEMCYGDFRQIIARLRRKS